MLAIPYQKKVVTLVWAFAALWAGNLNAYGQCGVYLKHASTQRFPYAKVYLNNAADMTGDGKPDLLASQGLGTPTFSRNRIFVIPNDGSGTFGSPVVLDPPSGDFSYQYFTGKVNNDAFNDIIAYQAFGGGLDPGTMFVYLNNGNGTFAAPVISSASGKGLAYALVDVNGDGLNDYVGFSGNGDFRYSPGAGKGTFGTAVTISSSDGVGLAGDFNNDGKVDFVNSRHLYMNNGSGTFTVSDMSGSMPPNSYVNSVQDLNGDNRSDIIVSTQTGFAVLKKTDAGFDTTTYSYPAGDATIHLLRANGDAFVDLIVSYRNLNQKVVFTNDGAGNFTRHDYDQRFYYFNFLNQVFADFDGDGRDDVVQSTSMTDNGTLMLPEVTSFTFKKNVCGRPGQPRIVDFDATGNTDYSFWNPATGDWSWRANPYDNETNQSETVNWGLGSLGDIPAPGDYDGDGITDRAVFRSSTGYWYVRRSSDLVWFTLPFGSPGDIPVAADYDGDTITDIAVWRPSDGNWYFWYMGTRQFAALHFGLNGDKPAPADFDGDLKTDIAVFRPSDGIWYYLKSSNAAVVSYRWGLSTDKPIPADFDGDGKADITVFRESNRVAYIAESYNSTIAYYPWGQTGDYLQVADYDGDFVADLGFYRPSTYLWYSTTRKGMYFGADNVLPVSSLINAE
jgi:FG-GAP-like repeat